MKSIGRFKLGLFIALVFAISLLIQTQNKEISSTTSQNQQQPPTTTEKIKEPFSYKGEEGKDALILLKEKAVVEQDKSGLVVSINGREAMVSKREYWAFYVNGQLAPVGPADYKTKDGDVIEWKIEKY